MTIIEIVHKYFDYVNKEKFEELFNLFSNNIQFSSPVNFVTNNREKIRKFYLNVPKNYPMHRDIPIHIIADQDNAAVKIKFEGRTHSGQKIEFYAFDWFSIDGDKISSISIFFDSLSLNRRLALGNGNSHPDNRPSMIGRNSNEL